jgi:phenylpropionate dioxygenase-like ring-hydroxylating dioxygenase large terminal subunit
MSIDFVKNVWYVVGLSDELKPESFIKKVVMNEPILLVRPKVGPVYAIKDICPHRGIPFSYGRLVNDEMECPYHGWRFDRKGTCTLIPSLCSGQDLDCTKIKVRSFPTSEQQGLIWIFFREKDFPVEQAPAIPIMKAFDMKARPDVVEVAKFNCHIDHAVIGLMDPAHGPYIHKSPIWRSEKTSYEKSKKFAPVPFGFQMVRHQPSKNSKAYKILGGQPTTEITFTLPSVRVEHIQVGKRNVYSYTALTPINEKETIIHQMMYWDHPLLTLLRPFVHQFAHFFLHQDIDAVNKQQEGLKYDPSLMLIKDADTQAKWYYALKNEWFKHLEEKSEFNHPVQETELRWKS